MTLVLNDDHVAQLVKMSDCVEVLEQAFRDLGEGKAFCAPRRDSFMASLRYSDGRYSFKTIEGGLERWGVVAQRINSDLITEPKVEGVVRRVKIPAAPSNRYVGLVFLYSSETLELLAIITDGHLQRLRVAGMIGVGAKYLARENSKIVALFGSGWQAETAAWALATVRPITTIRVFSPNEEHRKDFAKKVASTLGIEVTPVESPRRAIEGADIVATVTNSHSPVVRGEWIKPGMHLSCIMRDEFDEEVWRKSDFIVFSGPGGREGYAVYSTDTVGDSREGTSQRLLDGSETKRFQRYREKIYFLSDMLLGRAPKRTMPSQITLLNKTFGLGIEFAAVGKLVYDRACAAGVGEKIPTEWFCQTSHP